MAHPAKPQEARGRSGLGPLLARAAARAGWGAKEAEHPAGLLIGPTEGQILRNTDQMLHIRHRALSREQ